MFTVLLCVRRANNSFSELSNELSGHKQSVIQNKKYCIEKISFLHHMWLVGLQ